MTIRAPYKIKMKWIVAFLVLSACVDKIDFIVPEPEVQTVIEGMISDGPGPYEVKITRGLDLNANESSVSPVEHARVTLYDDEDHSEDLAEITPGVYRTGGIIQGKLGHTYHIVAETQEGTIFQSEPDILNPPGEIENIQYEFEARTVVKNYGEVVADVFNIYVDSYAGTSQENFVRWRFKGTYKVTTHPELHETSVPPYTPYKDPPSCSGYIITPGPVGSGGVLEQVGECTCCTCWINEFEKVPQLSDAELVTDNKLRHIKIAEVPINNFTFHEKYMVEVEQMSLSRKAFEFFKLIRQQKEGASNIFQPPSGEIIGNITSTNSNNPAIGMFWAGAIKKKYIFIPRDAVPYIVIPIDFVTDACTLYPNSTSVKPLNWE
jgi:hypothetical protein